MEQRRAPWEQGVVRLEEQTSGGQPVAREDSEHDLGTTIPPKRR